MSETYLGQIMLFGGNFAPQNFMLCRGQVLSVNQYSLLFSIMGVTFGGDGANTFGIPDLMGRAIAGAGQGTGLANYPLGTSTGSATVTLTSDQIPLHQHAFVAVTNQGTTQDAKGNVLATAQGGTKGAGAQANLYSNNAFAQWTTLRPLNILPAGGDGAHNNMQPHLPIALCLCVAGMFPPAPGRHADARS